jgi:hypothetical protein
MPENPGIIARLINRFVLGLSVVGITSFAQWLWSMSLLGRLHWFNVRGLRERRERGGGTVLSVVIIGFIIAGAIRYVSHAYIARFRSSYILIRALLQVYRWVETKTQALLVRAEYSILEVGE